MAAAAIAGLAARAVSGRGRLVVSIDLELAWGTCDRPLASAQRRALVRERAIVPRLLRSFAEFDVRATWAVVGHLLLEAAGGQLKLTATDLDLTICTTLGAEVDREGSVTLPAKRFSEIVRQLDPESTVTVDVSKANALITAGRANFHGNLIGGTADAARLDLDCRRDVVERLFDEIQRFGILLTDHLERAIHDVFSDGLLAALHHHVDETRNHLAPVLGIGENGTLRSGTFTRHKNQPCLT